MGAKTKSRLDASHAVIAMTPDHTPDRASLEISETAFEKRRGISKVEIRPGYAQVHITNLKEPLAPERLRMLEAINSAQISMDFLKLTPGGLSFLVTDGRADDVHEALYSVAPSLSVQAGRSIVMVHAVNMRDEEGLIAQIVSLAIGSGAAIDHLGDMHDRLLIVAPDADAQRIADVILELQP